MGKERILVMNLGSTSSKIAVYDDDKEVFNDTIRHSTEELAPFGDVTEQYEFRYNKIKESLASNGISIDSLTAAVYSILHTDNYKDAVMMAVNFGYDTDTNAAITGSIAGAMYGSSGIPQGWLDALRKKEDL